MVAIYLIQVMLIAAFGVVLGLALGAVMPFAAASALAGVIPVAVSASFLPGLGWRLPPASAFMTAFAFAVLPLGRAGEVPATALFRQQGVRGKRPAALALIC